MNTEPAPSAPIDTFLDVDLIAARYGWGRTKAYLEVNKPDFPNKIRGKWRLDTIYAWENALIAGIPEPRKSPEATSEAPIALPPRKRPGRKAESNDEG